MSYQFLASAAFAAALFCWMIISTRLLSRRPPNTSTVSVLLSADDSNDFNSLPTDALHQTDVKRLMTNGSNSDSKLLKAVQLCLGASADKSWVSATIGGNNQEDNTTTTNEFHDSKHFVDMVLKTDALTVTALFQDFLKRWKAADDNVFQLLIQSCAANPHNHKQFTGALHSFVFDHFRQPTDIPTASPILTSHEFIADIRKSQKLTPEHKQLAQRAADIYEELGKAYNDVTTADRTTAIVLPHPFVVPGARFREPYYWDSYWIIRGLLISRQETAAVNSLRNFQYSINQNKHIPNGFRLYYQDRSQPPMFFKMVDDYCSRLLNNSHTTLTEHLCDSLYTAVDLEYSGYWDTPASVVKLADGNTANRYGGGNEGGRERPESFRNDHMAADSFATDKQREQFYAHIRSGAESGWDFSSRWIAILPEYADDESTTTKESVDLNAQHKYPINRIRTRDVLPVDLNSLLYGMEICLSEHWSRTQDSDKSQHYIDKANARQAMMRKHMWDPIGPRWADAVMKSSGETELSRINSAASFVPLWADVPLSSSERCATAEYLFEHAGLVHEHGISATNKHTGHQWDYPNMWLPSAQMALYWAIFGQGKECTIASGNLRDKATTMVTHYLDNAYRALIRSKAGTDKLSDMLYLPEKFDVRIDGGPGGGGEYKNQYGFGWTVGVLIEWIYYRIIDFRMPQNNDFFAATTTDSV
eukprot:GHVS01081191.1.p1 GENE.GHVS01081191.1~~GHVS01081191.1.p1  ORF type:complete len:760 (-),score=125.52 GHVS01081191.1:209-2317(-)